MSNARIFILTLLAMIAFASNSLLCRAALKESSIDPATFTFVRIFSGALALCFVISVRKMLTINTTATPLVDTCSNSARVTDYSSLRYGNWALSVRAIRLRGWLFICVYISFSRNRRFAFVWSGSGHDDSPGTAQGRAIKHDPNCRLHRCGYRTRCACIPRTFRSAINWFDPDVRSRFSLGHLFTARQRRTESGKRHGRKFCPRGSVRRCSQHHFRSMDANYNLAGITYALISGAVTSGLGYVIWYSALPGLKTASAATVQLSVPVLAATGGILLLGEPITVRYMLASVAVLGGIALVVAIPHSQISSSKL